MVYVKEPLSPLHNFRSTATLNLDNSYKVLPKILLVTLLKCSQWFLLLATLVLATLIKCTLYRDKLHFTSVVIVGNNYLHEWPHF